MTKGCGIIASSGFVRPLDFVTSAAHAWSFWLLRSRYTNYAFEARRSSDNATTNVLFDRGVVTNNSIVSSGGTFGTWRGADTIFIRTIYDQMQNGGDFVQTTNSLQLTYTDNHYLSRPVWRSSSTTYMTSTSSILKNIVNTSFYVVANTTTGSASTNSLLWGGSGTTAGLYCGAANRLRFLFASPYGTADDCLGVTGIIPNATYFNYTAVRDTVAGTQRAWLNGANLASIATTRPAWPNTNLSLTLCTNGSNIAGGCMVGYMFACIAFPFALTAQQQSYLQANI